MCGDADPKIHTSMCTSLVITVLPLPVYSMDRVTEMDFVVVQTNPNINILGLPWMSDVGCTMSFNQKGCAIRMKNTLGFVERKPPHHAM